MRLLAYYSNKGVDEAVVTAVADGAAAHGVSVEIRNEDADPGQGDVVLLFGVKSRARYQEYRGRGAQTIIVDKGYVRHHVPGGEKWCEYWRVAVNAHHPTGYLMEQNRPSDRFDRLGLELKPWRRSGSAVIYAGSSEKYHQFNGLPDAHRYARKIVDRVRKVTDRPIVYRPKPSWKDALPVDGAAFSRWPERLNDLLKTAHVLVTNGSNACFESVIAGVPTIVLGAAVSQPISSTTLADIESPRMVSDDLRNQWAANLAYAQWTLEEFRSGEAWPFIAEQLS